MIGIKNFAILLLRLIEQRGAIVETDGSGRTDQGAGWSEIARTPVGAQIAFQRMVLLGVITDRTVGAGQRTLATAGTAALVDRHYPGDGILRNCLGMHRAGAQAGGALALLAGDGEKVETCRSSLLANHITRLR